MSSDTPKSEDQAPSEMVQRVAIAMAAVWGHAPGSWVDGTIQGYTLPQAKRDLFLDAAHKAIEAMREPTDEMQTEANRIWQGRMLAWSPAMWRVLIAVALGEKL